MIVWFVVNAILSLGAVVVLLYLLKTYRALQVGNRQVAKFLDDKEKKLIKREGLLHEREQRLQQL